MSPRPPLGITIFFLLAVCVLSPPAHSQSFSINTAVTQTASLYSYSFTLNYDQIGQVQTLTDSIYDWSFLIAPGVPPPTDITLPTGWKYSYDLISGQSDFYTEGPKGFGNGDFGPNVILPGQSLSGFGLTTPAAPDLSTAFATDEQFNQDATSATLPTAVPAPVPEVSTWQSLGAFLLLGGMLAIRRPHSKRG